MKILGIERDTTACNSYRIVQPLEKLYDKGLAETSTLVEGPQLATDEAFERVMGADIVLLHRGASKEWFDFIKLCQENGKIIVLDYDDDPFNTSPWNPYYKNNGTKEFIYKWPDGREEFLWKDGVNDFDIERNMIHQDMFRACHKKADLVTTTTPILQEHLKTINKNTIVLPNLVNFDDYPQGEMVKKEVRIGWHGGVSHYEDLWMVKDAIVDICKKHKNVKFIYCGDFRFRHLFKDIPDSQLEMHYWVSQPVFPYKLFTMNLDIGLCPVVDNVFNRNKSAIKYFEYSVVGAASVVSDIPPYAPVVGDTALTASEDGWFDALDKLVTDKKFRKSLASKAYENVYENHNADTKAHLWFDAYEKLIKQEVTV